MAGSMLLLAWGHDEVLKRLGVRLGQADVMLQSRAVHATTVEAAGSVQSSYTSIRQSACSVQDPQEHKKISNLSSRECVINSMLFSTF